MDAFAASLDADEEPPTGGAEGLQDMKIMAAIDHSAATGRPLAMPPAPGLDGTLGPYVPA